jgi:hypothetical protein
MEKRINYWKVIMFNDGLLKFYPVLGILEILHDNRTYAYFGDELCPKSRKGTREIK